MADAETAPYAPVHNVLTVIRKLRDRGLPNPLSLKELERTGVPEGNAPRTLASLRFLGLVNEEDYLTPAFERFGKAPTSEYQEVLAEIVRAAYAPVFTLVDPAEDSEIAIQDAFRHYKPPAQRGRMVTLFLGLCREAAMIPGGPPTRKAKMRRGDSAKSQTPKQPRKDATLHAEPGPASASTPPSELHATDGPDPRLVSVLMQKLPASGKWTQAKRDKWLQAVAANVDLMIEIVEEANGE